MKPRTVAIVQARMGSARFPGKILANLGGYPLLEWVLRRVSRASLLDETVLATSTKPQDDALAAVAKTIGIRTFRGDESDVLGRFVMTANMSDAEQVVRICADNPFVDPDNYDFRLNDLPGGGALLKGRGGLGSIVNLPKSTSFEDPGVVQANRKIFLPNMSGGIGG